MNPRKAQNKDKNNVKPTPKLEPLTISVEEIPTMSPNPKTVNMIKSVITRKMARLMGVIFPKSSSHPNIFGAMTIAGI